MKNLLASKLNNRLISFKIFCHYKINLLIIITALAFNTCSENPINGDDNLEPGRRDYNWKVDTLSSPPNLFYLFALWGSSPTNLWAVGHSDETVNSIWYYDGKTWTKTTQRLSSNIQSIWGFDSSNIWICDSPGGNIFKYDGKSWNKFGFFPYPEYSITYFNNIWGINTSEIYIAGAAYDSEKGIVAILMFYNGIDWKYINLPEKKLSFVWVKKSRENNYLYLTGIESLHTGDIYRIFRYDGNSFDELYSGAEAAYAYEVNDRIYIGIGKKIYIDQNGQLVLWKDFNQSNYLGGFYGRSENDFFGVASDGLAHYNGTDLKTIYPTNLFINNIFVLDQDIYMICEYRIIIQGKLKHE